MTKPPERRAGVERRRGERRAGDRRLTDRQLKSVAAAYLILLLSFAGGLWALEQRDIRRAERVAVRTCERVNHLRSAINDNALVLYVATLNAIKREQARGTDVRSMKQIARLYQYRPLTDCRRAVADPEHYDPPDPRPWTREQVRSIRLQTENR